LKNLSPEKGLKKSYYRSPIMNLKKKLIFIRLVKLPEEFREQAPDSLDYKSNFSKNLKLHWLGYACPYVAIFNPH